MVPDDDDAATLRQTSEAGVADTVAAAGVEDTVLGPTPAPSRSAPPTDGSTGTGSTTSGPVAIAGAAARYALGRVLGKGGMGEVRLARDPRVDRDVAVKLMRDRGAPPEAVARFLREARVQGRLEHPNVVPVHDLGVDDRGAPYFAMKRLTGTTLADAIAAIAKRDATAAERWPRRLLLDRLVDVCLAIEFAHERGVVHRDLKPSNIMLGDYGEAYVLDWGIAKVGAETGAAIPMTDLGSLDGADTAQTAAGSLLGTPGYMAPEQMRGETVDRRADVYALGCVLFEILTLKPALPRGHEAYEATLDAPAHRPRERDPEADVAPELDDACARATAPAPADRTPTARELATAIRAYLDGDRDLARRRELAQTHAAAAAQAWKSGDGGRAQAVREAGHAIAIDPTCRQAQDVLREVLFSVPTEQVPAVQQAVDAERLATSKVQLAIATRIYLGFLFVLWPAMLVLGVRPSAPFVLIAAMMAFNMVLTMWGQRVERPPTTLIYVAILNHGAQLATTGVLFGPMVVLPAVAVGSLAGFASFPLVRRPSVILVVHLVALAIPFALELSGIVPSTFSVSGGALHLHPWALGVDGKVLVAIATVAMFAQIVSTAALTIHQRDAQERAQEQIHLTKWHLDQLLPMP